MTLPTFFGGGDEDDQPQTNDETRNPETGEYDLSDDVGTRIGESSNDDPQDL